MLGCTGVSIDTDSLGSWRFVERLGMELVKKRERSPLSSYPSGQSMIFSALDVLAIKGFSATCLTRCAEVLKSVF